MLDFNSELLKVYVMALFEVLKWDVSSARIVAKLFLACSTISDNLELSVKTELFPSVIF